MGGGWVREGKVARIRAGSFWIEVIFTIILFIREKLFRLVARVGIAGRPFRRRLRGALQWCQ